MLGAGCHRGIIQKDSGIGVQGEVRAGIAQRRMRKWLKGSWCQGADAQLP